MSHQTFEPPTYKELTEVLYEVMHAARRIRGQPLPNDPRTEYSIPKLILDKVDSILAKLEKAVGK